MAATSHLKSFQALAMALRTGSLTTAADALAITPAAVGQRIKLLETYLGVELVVRGRQGLRPTEDLAAALPDIQAAFQALDRAAGLLDLRRGDEIHIAAPSDFVELWLKPRLARFQDGAPRTRFCINGEGDIPYRLGRVDCAIRFAPRDPQRPTDDLFADWMIPICTPENLRRLPPLDAKDRLEGFPLLHLDAYKDDPAALGWPQWIAAQGLSRTSPERGIRFQRIAPALDAVQSAAGVMICGLALVLERVEAGTLAMAYPTATGIWTRNLYQARFAPCAGRPHLQRFRQWLHDESRATAEALRRLAG